MRRLFATILFLLPVVFSWSIPITEDYTKASTIAQDYNRPMLLLFTGSDWCSWSQKILTDVFKDKNFEKIVGTHFIIVHADFPEVNLKSAATLKQNQELKEKYGIQSFPTIVMLDSLGREITRVGYMSGDPEKFAIHLTDLYVEYAKLHNEVSHFNIAKASIDSVQTLYEKACDLRCPHYMNHLLNIGVEADQGVFFPLEKYTALVHEKKGKSQDAKALKAKIIQRDPDNKEGARLRLALLDFQANEDDAEAAIEPLGQYIANFGGADKENVWRLHLIISEFFSEHGDEAKAKEYAEKSLSQAPKECSLSVENVIQAMKTN